MLTEIRLKNFKCFQKITKIPCRRLNLFTGINGRGKSTTLQALLLMRQSPEHSRTTSQIIFNGSCVNLGTFNDIRNSAIPRSEPTEVAFRFDDGDNFADLTYFLVDNQQDEMIADIKKIDGLVRYNQTDYTLTAEATNPWTVQLYNQSTAQSLSATVFFWNSLLFDLTIAEGKPPLFSYIRELIDFRKIHYVSADRIGPQDYYPKQSFTEFANVGSRGEFTANVLSKKKNEEIQPSLYLERGATHAMLDQTEAWLDAIFGGGKISVEQLHANIVLMALNAERTTHFYKPLNVGFGYSYALPIIVSGLIAQPGEILIVENPEAHLHPYAQSQLAKFLARVSATGVQVFIESHSDHVLNALRVSVLDRVIIHTDLNILYFTRNAEQDLEQIPVNIDGAIEYWPVGFFDQTDKDFERLFAL